MDIRKYFNVEVTKNKQTVFTKEKSTTDGSKPFIEYTDTKIISQKPKKVKVYLRSCNSC